MFQELDNVFSATELYKFSADNGFNPDLKIMFMNAEDDVGKVHTTGAIYCIELTRGFLQHKNDLWGWDDNPNIIFLHKCPMPEEDAQYLVNLEFSLKKLSEGKYKTNYKKRISNTLYKYLTS